MTRLAMDNQPLPPDLALGQQLLVLALLQEARE